MVGSLDRRLAEELAVSLCAVPLGPGGRYSGGIAAWLERQLLPRLPPGPTAEARIVAALSGTRESPAARLSWEGQAYRVDLASAESRRLELVRERQQSYPVDLALALHRVTEWLAADDLDADGIREAATELAVVADDFRDAITRPEPNVLPRGVQPPRRADERIDTFVKSLTSIAAGRDPSRAARVGAQLAEFVDLALGEALISLAYASALGDPDGTALLPRNVALRHDFGLTHSSGGMRSRLPWGLPRQEFQPGVPWHVTGSALGLDIALAPVSLRRANIDLLGEAPRLPSHEREVLSVSVVLMDARRLDDEDREQIVQAVVRGRQRVAGLSAGRESFASIADLLTMDGRRRRAIGWMLDNDPAGVPSMFTLVELMTLGGGAPGTDLDAWGMSALASWGCACTRLLSPHHWALLAGRPQVGLMVPAMPDLNLHVAMVLRELGVPSVLTPPVVAAVVQDFAHRVAPTDPNDWWALVRAARAVPREEIEDSVADATGTDGPLVPDVTGSNLGR
jgi:hypothetical protein